jgi:hypothetical protein
VESHDCNWAARGWEAMSFFVCFLYAFEAVVNIVLKFGGRRGCGQNLGHDSSRILQVEGETSSGGKTALIRTT